VDQNNSECCNWYCVASQSGIWVKTYSMQEPSFGPKTNCCLEPSSVPRTKCCLVISVAQHAVE
jgi:hypothetical protein